MLEQYNSDEAAAAKASPQPEGSVATGLLDGIADPGQNGTNIAANKHRNILD